MMDQGLSRRRFTQSLGVVAASFALAPGAGFSQTPGALLFSVRNNRRLERWIRLGADETVTVFTGKRARLRYRQAGATGGRSTTATRRGL